MARVSYEKQQAIRDIVYEAERKIVENDLQYFTKTENGKMAVKLKTKARKLELQAAELYKQAKLYGPGKTIGTRSRGDVNVTDTCYAKLEKLEGLHKELAMALAFASNGKEFELIQAFIKAIKSL